MKKQDNNLSKVHTVLAIFSLLPSRRILQLYFVIFVSCVSSLVEIFGFAAIIPIAVTSFFDTNPNNLVYFDFLNGVLGANQISTTYSVIVLLLIVVFSFVVRALNVFISSRLAYSCGADLEFSLFRNVLSWDYQDHLSTHSSEVISAITLKCTSIVYNVFLPIIHMASAFVILTSIIFFTIIFGDVIYLIPVFLIVVFYIIVLSLLNNFLTKKGKMIAFESGRVQKILTEALSNIREVIVHNVSGEYSSLFQSVNRNRRHSQALVNFASGLPRILSESLLIVVMFGSFWWLSASGIGVSNGLPMLLALGVVAQRLLPIVQSGFNGIGLLMSAHQSVCDVLSLFRHNASLGNNEDHIYAHSAFQSHRIITFENVSFRYPGSNRNIISNINLIIPRGSRVAIVGPSGSGKSTLVDLFCGLLKPSEGSIYVDNYELNDGNRSSWYQAISVVSQNVVLQDSSVLANIAFGVPASEIDTDRVVHCAKLAQCHEFVSSLSFGYETTLGERAVKLSGGQRQRLAIARALYFGSELIVFDEATSALDPETEKLVMRSIFSNCENTTILLISHNKSEFSDFDQIVNFYEKTS